MTVPTVAPRCFVFTAVHFGPYQSLLPLEAVLEPRAAVYVVEGISKAHRKLKGEPLLDVSDLGTKYGGADSFLAALRPAAVVRGVSEGVEGDDAEALLAEAARARSVPVFAVEDFPGNFWPRPEERLDALFVEDESARALHASRGVPSAKVYVTGNPRYDALRRVDRAARRAETRQALGLQEETAVLWVGQPDAGDSAATLERLLPDLKRLGVTLLFRAHPRDAGYRTGRYDQLFASSGMRVLDVTSAGDVVGLCCASDLVATQFSSVAVEAGYLGTPAVFAVFEDLGGRYLRTHKGYAVPPWCENNCAFLIDDVKIALPVVDRALHDAGTRRVVLENFSRRYTMKPDSAPAIAAVIRERVGG